MSMAQVDRLHSVVINAFGLKLIDSFRGLSWSALCILSLDRLRILWLRLENSLEHQNVFELDGTHLRTLLLLDPQPLIRAVQLICQYIFQDYNFEAVFHFEKLPS